MILLGIDYGQKRTGIACCNATQSLVFPCCTLAMQGKDVFFAQLLALAEEKKAEGFVVGLPLRSDGTESETTRQIQNMVARLKRRSNFPVYLVNEMLSSSEAEARLRELGKNPKLYQGLLDQMAAVIILESFLALPTHERVPV